MCPVLHVLPSFPVPPLTRVATAVSNVLLVCADQHAHAPFSPYLPRLGHTRTKYQSGSHRTTNATCNGTSVHRSTHHHSRKRQHPADSSRMPSTTNPVGHLPRPNAIHKLNPLRLLQPVRTGLIQGPAPSQYTSLHTSTGACEVAQAWASVGVVSAGCVEPSWSYSASWLGSWLGGRRMARLSKVCSRAARSRPGCAAPPPPPSWTAGEGVSRS